MKISEHKMLSFSVRKEIIKNTNRLVAILLFIVGENEFLKILWPIYKLESSHCHYLKMLELQKNKRNNLDIFFERRDLRKLTCPTAKFQEDPIEPLREIAWRSYGI